MSETTHIYIVGYPKSGNTWLARMLAKATKLPVESLDDEHPEVAADVNRDICGDGRQEQGCIFKLHEMPANFEARLARKTGKHQIKVIYIYRDIEDVFISSFFYFKKSGCEQYIEKSGNPGNVSYPVWLARRIRWRIHLNRYLNSFVRQGYAKDSVTYAHHLSAWFAYLNGRNSEHSHAVTRYEDLINDPVPELKRICGCIGFHDLDASTLEDIVRSESFSSRKQEIEKVPNDLTFGKEFNKRFLRTGKSGDHKRFLTESQAKRLRESVRGIVSRP